MLSLPSRLACHGQQPTAGPLLAFIKHVFLEHVCVPVCMYMYWVCRVNWAQRFFTQTAVDVRCSEGSKQACSLRVSFPLNLSTLCIRNSVFKVIFFKLSISIYFSSGLFEKHKLLFSFNMTIKIEQAEGRVPQEELDFFLKGNEFASFHFSQLT